MIKLFICLFVGFVIGYILRIREEKHERKMKEIDRQANEQALDEIEEYCTYMNTFNKYNKTNKGLDVDNVLDIINKAKEQ